MRTLPTHIERAFTGPAWHAEALDTLLRDLAAEEAARRPAPGLHTIAELAGHIGVWLDVVRRRLAGDDVTPGAEENFAPLDTRTDEAWRAAVRQLGDRHLALARAAAALSDEQLRATLPGRDLTAEAMLLGIAEHTAWHGGQIAMLRRMVRGSG